MSVWEIKNANKMQLLLLIQKLLIQISKRRIKSAVLRELLFFTRIGLEAVSVALLRTKNQEYLEGPVFIF